MHDFARIWTRGAAPDTDVLEQCRVCNRVRLTYTYATLERQLATVRDYDLGMLVEFTDDCPWLDDATADTERPQ